MSRSRSPGARIAQLTQHDAPPAHLFLKFNRLPQPVAVRRALRKGGPHVPDAPAGVRRRLRRGSPVARFPPRPSASRRRASPRAAADPLNCRGVAFPALHRNRAPCRGYRAGPATVVIAHSGRAIPTTSDRVPQVPVCSTMSSHDPPSAAPTTPDKPMRMGVRNLHIHNAANTPIASYRLDVTPPRSTTLPGHYATHALHG